MSSMTLEFPSAPIFLAGIESPRSRESYVRGLAFLDDHTNEWEEARTGPTRRSLSIDELSEFKKVVELAGPLGPSLAQGAFISSRLSVSETGNWSVNRTALNEHLRISMRERILDLFDCARRSQAPAIVTRNEYDPLALTIAATSRDVARMRISGIPDAVIRQALEVSHDQLEVATRTPPAPALYQANLPHYLSIDHVTYRHINSRGITYYLHTTQVALRGHKRRAVYFFAKVPFFDHGTPCPLPPDYFVIENPQNGFLTLSKK